MGSIIKKMKLGRRGKLVPPDQQIEYDQFAKHKTPEKKRHHKDDNKFFLDSCISIEISDQDVQQQQELEDETGASSSKVPYKTISFGKDNSDVPDSDNNVLVDVEGKDYESPFVESCFSIEISDQAVQQQQELEDETGASSSKVADKTISLWKDNSDVSYGDDNLLVDVEGKDYECPFVDSCFSIEISDQAVQQQQELEDETEASTSKVAGKTISLGKDNSDVSYSDDNVSDDDEGKEYGRLFVDPCITKPNLRRALQQQQELGNETGASSSKVADKTISLGKDNSNVPDIDDNVIGDDEWKNYGCPDISEEFEKQYEIFMGKDPNRQVDLLREKLAGKRTEKPTFFSDHESVQLQDLDPRLKLLYEEVRDILAKYRCGKVPEAFELVPRLRKWEQILYVTDPNGWSAAAMYMATIIFSSKVEEKITQRFYNLVLLPRVRDDISEYKRLNFHLYQALKTALSKPGPFMKGILLPLCESGTCTLREAVIVGSVVSRNSIPMLHSEATILKLVEMDYTGANSVFLMVLLDKKYPLPYRVVDAVVFHFLKFEKETRELTVSWHHALLTFVQRYKSNIRSEHKDALLNLLSRHVHRTMTSEIRKELQNAKCRDVATSKPPPKIFLN